MTHSTLERTVKLEVASECREGHVGKRISLPSRGWTFPRLYGVLQVYGDDAVCRLERLETSFYVGLEPHARHRGSEDPKDSNWKILSISNFLTRGDKLSIGGIALSPSRKKSPFVGIRRGYTHIVMGLLG